MSPDFSLIIPCAPVPSLLAPPALWNAKPIPLGPYALEDLIKKFDLPADVFDK